MNLTNKNAVAADALRATMNAGGGRLLDLLHHAMVALLHPLAVTKPPIFLLPCNVLATFIFLFVFADVNMLEPEEPGRFRSFLLDFTYPRVPSSMRDGWPAARPGERVPPSIQWQASLDPHQHSAITGYGAHSYGSHGSSSSGPPVFPGPELPPGGCLAGVPADSSCALSLLSTQQWDTTQSAGHSRAASMPATAGFDGNPVAPSLMASSYIAPSPWTGSRGHAGGRDVPPQLPPDVPLDEVHSGSSSHHGQFSGELELALQGNRPAPAPRIDHGSTSTFDQASNTTDWSL